MGAAGGFFVVWVDSQESGESVVGQYFDRGGRRSGGEIAVGTGANARQQSPSTALAANGTLVVTWSSRDPQGPTDVVGRRFRVSNLGNGDPDADGVPSAADNCPSVPNSAQTRRRRRRLWR